MRFRGRIKRGKLKKRKGQAVTSPIIRGERIPAIVLQAPEHFSLVNNKDETLAFFDKALSRIQNCKVRQSIFFDLQKYAPSSIFPQLPTETNRGRFLLTRLQVSGTDPTNVIATCELFPR